MARETIHREWFRPVERGGRKSCSHCKLPLDPEEWIWSWGNYVHGKWRSVRDCCKKCWYDVRERLVAHAKDCPRSCSIELVTKGADRPVWMTLADRRFAPDLYDVRMYLAHELPLDRWPGRCYEVAAAIKQRFCLDAKLCYGHYTGPVHEYSYFTHTRPFQRHGWLELWDGRIYDPTRWVFERPDPAIYANVEPVLYVGPNVYDYDLGGMKYVAAAFDVSLATIPGDEADAEVIKLGSFSPVGRAALRSWFGHSSWVNRAQLLWLCHIPLNFLHDYGIGEEVYEAIVRSGWGAAIPIDQREHVLGEGGSPARCAEFANKRRAAKTGEVTA